MSKSFRKRPLTGRSLCNSEKRCKKSANRKFRRIEKNLICSNRFDEIPLKSLEVMNSWDFCKEGKLYFGDMKYHKDKSFREYYKKLLRK